MANPQASLAINEARYRCHTELRALTLARSNAQQLVPANAVDAEKKSRLLEKLDAALKDRHDRAKLIDAFDKSLHSPDDLKRLQDGFRRQNQKLQQGVLRNFSNDGMGEVCLSCVQSELNQLNPCRGVGMDEDEARARFVKRVREELFDEWSALSEKQRREKLQEIANAELKRSGHPGIVMPAHTPESSKLFQERPRLRGMHRAAANTVRLRPEYISSSKLPDDAGSIAATVYHEARHAEQAQLAALYAVRQHKKASALKNKPPLTDEQLRNALMARGVSKEVATAAVRADAHPAAGSKHPDPLKGREGCAETMWRNKFDYGADKDRKSHWAKVMANDESVKKKLEAANAALKQEKARVPQDQKKLHAAELRQFQAKKAVSQAYRSGYRLLPNELDAHAVGDSVEAAFKNDEVLP